MLGSSYPSRTLAEVAGEQFVVRLLAESLAGIAADFAWWLRRKPAGDLDCWRNIAITVRRGKPA